MAERRSMRDRVKEDAQKSTTEGASYIKTSGKVTFFVPKAEEYELDFLPFENDKDSHPKGYEKGELIPFVRFKIHKGIVAEDNKYICPTSIGKKCPICEERARMAKSSKSDPDLVKSLAAKDRMIFNVLDLKEEKKGVQLFEHSYHLFGKKLLGDIDKSENTQSSRRRSTAHAGFAELEGGQTLFVSFVEKKMGTNKFYEADRIDADDRDPYNDGILDEAHNLDDCLKILSYEELEVIFLELDPSEQGGNRKREEKDEEPPSRDRSSRRRGEPEPEPEPESGSRRRSRGAEKEADPEPTPASSRRRGAAEPEPEKEKEALASGRRSRGAATPEPEKEAPVSTRRSRGADPEPEPEKETPTPTRRARGAAAEPEPEKEAEKPTRPRRGEEKTGHTCVAGKVFGKDCGKDDKCYDCPDETWEACNKLTNG